MICIVIGGVYLAAQIPNVSNTTLAYLLLALSAVLLAANVVMLARVRDFAWRRFRQVFGWALLGYAVIAGMLLFVFVYDKTPAKLLTILALMLLVFAVNIPLMLAFSVARYQDPAAQT